ncbi:hypothetical protein KBI51_05510 [Aerococcaceae bacterium zg-ZUI334]|uniref:hypothetical protein n=1 Tax=Aerococcaceae bacterium zg-252 TaxID=2796928 RepID=UPI001B9AF7EE|nr:hypothetical protein [Aerococcaceae bacterium zg-ZUI334]
MKRNDITVCGITILSCVALLNSINVSAEEAANDMDNSTIEAMEMQNNDQSEPVEQLGQSDLISETAELVGDEMNLEKQSKLDAPEPAQLAAQETNGMNDKEEIVAGENEKENIGAEAVKSTVIETNNVTEQHDWQGTYFGESTNANKNSVTVNEDGSVTLKAANFDPDTKLIKDKGGKFTAYHDGISYYYTTIDAKTENFDFSATFNVDYLNPNADGQEGFGVIVRDSVGEIASGDQQFPSNSAGTMAMRVRMTDAEGKKVDLKPGVTSRFVTGLTPEVIAEGATAMAVNGKNTQPKFIEDIPLPVKQGEKYTFNLKKTNTGYHASYTHNGKTYENILYGVDKLLQLDTEKVYLGVAAARGVVVTVSDMKLTVTDPKTDAPAEKEPVALIEPAFNIKNYNRTGNKNYQLELESNVPGTAKVYDINNNQVAEVDLEANYAKFVPIELTKGDNHYRAVFTPQNPETVTDATPITQTSVIHHKTYEGYYKDNIGTYLNVSPTGTAEGDGTVENPLDILTAIDYLQPGQMIELKSGVYEMERSVTIQRGNDGTETLKKSLGTMSKEPAIFDFSKGGSFNVNGNHWQIDNIHVRNTPDNTKGMTIGGHHNLIQRVEAYNNGDTGIQISGSASEYSDFWPSHNIVENSTSYNNVDSGHNNADGFAAKITVGEGNIFRGDMAYNNIDDGWDLFAKLENGVIGVVTIEDSIAYRNGSNLEGTVQADGNGFKLGGDGIAVPHILRHSLSFDNDADGVTSNSNPAVNVYNTISVKNKGTNLSLYGKGKATVTSKVNGLITLDAGKKDVYGNDEVLAGERNYINGVNPKGEKVLDDWFVHTDTSRVPLRNEDGSINLNGLFVLTKGQVGEFGIRPVISKVLLPAFRLPGETDDLPNTNEHVSPIAPGDDVNNNGQGEEKDNKVPIVNTSDNENANQGNSSEMQEENLDSKTSEFPEDNELDHSVDSTQKDKGQDETEEINSNEVETRKEDVTMVDKKETDIDDVNNNGQGEEKDNNVPIVNASDNEDVNQGNSSETQEENLDSKNSESHEDNELDNFVDCTQNDREQGETGKVNVNEVETKKGNVATVDKKETDIDDVNNNGQGEEKDNNVPIVNASDNENANQGDSSEMQEENLDSKTSEFLEDNELDNSVDSTQKDKGQGETEEINSNEVETKKEDVAMVDKKETNIYIKAAKSTPVLPVTGESQINSLMAAVLALCSSFILWFKKKSEDEVEE